MTMRMVDHLDDMSTLGMDADGESSIVSIDDSMISNQQNGGGGGNDIDEDDIEGDIKRYNEQHALVVEGFKCPDEFINVITPMEFEEMVNLFIKFDTDHSNSIDIHEARKILVYINMESSLDKAEELLKVIDTDHSGEIDFNEFCNFIVLMKRGDSRLVGFNSMLGMISSTPLGELEKQATIRKLKINFKIIEQRQATLTQPTLWVVEVNLYGNFQKLVNGEVIIEKSIKRFQGMGNTTKEAKYNAASNALVSLGDTMPGD